MTFRPKAVQDEINTLGDQVENARTQLAMLSGGFANWFIFRSERKRLRRIIAVCYWKQTQLLLDYPIEVTR